MLDNLKKSISSIIHERTSSPFYGTLIISWLIWNWKIVYLTLFISEDRIKSDKISFISDNFSDPHILITYPLVSTLLLLTLIPFISNGAYWLNLKFEKWKKDKKNQVEKKQLLTVEQSMEIREQLLNQENRFEKLLEDKNNEINQLRTIIDESQSKSLNIETTSLKTQTEAIDFDKISAKIKAIDKDLIVFIKVLELMQGDYPLADRADISPKLITILEINDVIEPKGNGRYNITQNGKKLAKRLL